METDKQAFMTELLEISNKLAGAPPWLVKIQEFIRERARLGYRKFWYFRISDPIKDCSFSRSVGFIGGMNNSVYLDSKEEKHFLNWLKDQGFETEKESSWINVYW